MIDFTVSQLVAHGIGDYILQGDWMANEKTKQSLAAAVHTVTYTLPFLFLTLSPLTLFVICITHFAIDRWRLARYVVWFKNQLAPKAHRSPWSECSATGYHESRPVWLSVWLLIIADNLIHVIINGAAISWLG
jgi:hypothetical protein